MCGIVGILGRRKKQKLNLKELHRMCEIQRHRGPDDEGNSLIDLEHESIREVHENWVEGKALLGFNRLSIQDLTPKGHQPMISTDGKVVIAFNGEIYNFKQLRENLREKGYIFFSSTDTEVLLYLYKEYGIEKTLEYINGMYAFIIIDLIKNRCYVVRDRFGIKPMYIAHTEDAILFSSEMKSFLEYHSFYPKLNKNALEEFLLFKEIIKETLLENVEELDVGTYMTINLSDNEITYHKYFDMESFYRCNDDISYSSIKKKLKEKLEAVVNRQVISDAKVGCQLSGGIDSSIISLICAQQNNIKDVVSCKVDVDWQSDAPYIEKVKNQLCLNPYTVSMDSNVFNKNLADNIWHFERPFSHTPAAGMFLISDYARKSEIKVLMSGEGADELFGGYKEYKKFSFGKEKDLLCDIDEWIIFKEGKENDDLMKKIISDIEVEKHYQKRRDIVNHFTGSPLDRLLKYEMTVQLVELLNRQDKMSMAHSVENRVPFLDNELVEFVWKIPERFLMDEKTNQGKFILKDIVADYFGHDFAFRKKVGFFIPGNLYLNQNRGYLDSIIKKAKRRGILNYDVVEEWSKGSAYVQGGLNHFESALYLKMITFEIWCEKFLDKKLLVS